MVTGVNAGVFVPGADHDPPRFAHGPQEVHWSAIENVRSAHMIYRDLHGVLTGYDQHPPRGQEQRGQE